MKRYLIWVLISIGNPIHAPLVIISKLYGGQNLFIFVSSFPYIRIYYYQLGMHVGYWDYRMEE